MITGRTVVNGRIADFRVNDDGTRSVYCREHGIWYGGHCPSCAQPQPENRYVFTALDREKSHIARWGK